MIAILKLQRMKLVKLEKIIFTSSKELKKGHYLKLSNKGTHINSYEEVQKEQVPEKALKAIDNNKITPYSLFTNEYGVIYLLNLNT